MYTGTTDSDSRSQISMDPPGSSQLDLPSHVNSGQLNTDGSGVTLESHGHGQYDHEHDHYHFGELPIPPSTVYFQSESSYDEESPGDFGMSAGDNITRNDVNVRTILGDIEKKAREMRIGPKKASKSVKKSPERYKIRRLIKQRLSCSIPGCKCIITERVRVEVHIHCFLELLHSPIHAAYIHDAYTFSINSYY